MCYILATFCKSLTPIGWLVLVIGLLCVEPIYPQYSGVLGTCQALRYWFFDVLGSETVKMCLVQGHNAVPSVRLEPATRRSWVKHSTTDPSASSHQIMYIVVVHSSFFRLGAHHDFELTESSGSSPRYSSDGTSCTGIAAIMDYDYSPDKWSKCSNEDFSFLFR